MKTLRIGAHEYDLVVASNDQGDCGATDYINSTITIHKDMQLSMKGATLLHEAMHALNTTLGEEHVGHAFLDSFAEQLYHFLDINGLLDKRKLKELLG